MRMHSKLVQQNCVYSTRMMTCVHIEWSTTAYSHRMRQEKQQQCRCDQVQLTVPHRLLHEQVLQVVHSNIIDNGHCATCLLITCRSCRNLPLHTIRYFQGVAASWPRCWCQCTAVVADTLVWDGGGLCVAEQPLDWAIFMLASTSSLQRSSQALGPSECSVTLASTTGALPATVPLLFG
jgi:hypothetical protein